MSDSSEIWQEKAWILTKAILKNIPGIKITAEIAEFLEAIDKVDQEKEKNELLEKLENVLSNIEVTEVEFIQCTDYKAVLRYKPSDPNNIVLLPIGGPVQKPGYDFSVCEKELQLNIKNEPCFSANERLCVIYSRFFQMDNK